MEWTSERPTARGWYWHRDGKIAVIVYVRGDETASMNAVSATFPITYFKGEWCGPILPPS